jgi:hypothetical protein
MSHRVAHSATLPACVLLLVMLTAMAGCVPAPPDSTGNPSPDAASGSRIADRLADDGTIPLDLALDLFAAGLGPIDGGEADAVDQAMPSGTMAIRGLLGHWDELTVEQQATVDAVLASSGPAAAGAAGDVSAQVVRAVHLEPAESIRGITELVAEVQAELEALLGFRLGVPIHAGASSMAEDPETGAVTWGSVGGRPVETGRMDTCEIAVLPPAWDLIDTPQVRTLIAHEVMHCFQYDSPDGVADALDAAAWIVEGGASFAAMEVAPTDFFDWAWVSWLNAPNTPLFKRDYDALGVFAVAEQEGADVWRHLVPLLQSDGTSAGMELLFERPMDEALTAVARRLVRQAELGQAWESGGPGITETRGAIGIEVANGASITDEVSILSFATAPYVVQIDPASEVVDVAVGGGRGALGTPSGLSEQIGPDFSGRYCVTDFCACPEGGGVGGIEIPAGGPLGLALRREDPAARAVVTVTVRVSVISLAEACADRAPEGVLVVRFHEPDAFEVHGGHCIVQDSGDLLIQAGDGRMPEAYHAPPEHRDDVAVSIYKNPNSGPEAGSVDLRFGSTQVGGGSIIHVSPDRLSGSFALDSGYAGEWVCAELVTAAEAFGTG